MLTILMVAGATAVSAQDWVKLGEKDVNFGIDHDRVSAAGKGAIREINFVARKNPIQFTKVVINYKNGEHQDVDYAETLVLDKNSRSITIEGTGRKIASVDVWYSTDSMNGKHAKLEVYGRS
jgi:pectin methylesterase-like acyl-CoA thioesterase